MRAIELLARCYEYDIEVLTTPWVCAAILPAVLYFVFMILKWMALTVPIWVPLAIVASSLKLELKK